MDSTEKKTITNPEIYSQTRHRDQGYKRAAALLMVLDEMEAQRVFLGLNQEEAEGVAAEMAELAPMTLQAAAKLLEEFGYEPAVRNPTPLDGAAAARKWLALR